MSATVDVNVANQAYPAPPPGSQALPTPSAIAVASFPALQPSFSLGAATPATPENLVAAQNNTFQPAREWLVTENGNFQTNNTVSDAETFTISSVTSFGSDSDQSTVYQIVLLQNGVVANLRNFGVDFAGLIVSFPAAAAAASPENVPQRPISYFNDPSIIVVPKYDSFGHGLTLPVAGNTVRIGVLRQGPSNTVNVGVSEVDVVIAPSPPVATTTPAPRVTPLGNISATDGVVRPFIGEGQRLPPFVGTFEVEDQIPIGHGLPSNVFV
jgi:hypothetical protein